MIVYKYGMRLRGFSPSCQPMQNYYRRIDDPSGKYHDIIVYIEPLTDKQIKDYELDFLGKEVAK